MARCHLLLVQKSCRSRPWLTRGHASSLQGPFLLSCLRAGMHDQAMQSRMNTMTAECWAQDAERRWQRAQRITSNCSADSRLRNAATGL